jgi:hypothetical protein
MTIVDTNIISRLQSERAFRHDADGDEPLRQRLLAYAIAQAELGVDPTNPRRIQAVEDLARACAEYYPAPIYGTDGEPLGEDFITSIGTLVTDSIVDFPL